MKRTLLFIACMLASLTMLAEEYYPEGTKWTEIRLDTLKYDSWYSKVGAVWVPNFETIEYYVKGEYVDKQGGKYRCVYTNGPEWTDSLTLLLQEAGNSVMVSVLFQDYDGNSNYFPLCPGTAYQFDWSVGKALYFEDIMMSNTTSLPRYYGCYGIINEIKEGSFGGVRPLKYVDLDGKAPSNERNSAIQYVDTQGGRIMQGIGITEWKDGECLFGPPDPYSASGGEYQSRHYRSMLVHFERDGEVLYDVWPDLPQNDYLPFVELGKKWNVVYSVTNPYAHCYLGKYQMSEEVERDGKTYVHAYLRLDDDTGTWYNAGLFREENRRVYKYDETAGREFMLYDFSLKEGDTFIYEPDLYQSYNCKVLKQGWLDDGPQIATSCTLTADGTLDIKYRPLRTWTIGHDDGKGNYYEDITWVECIGALRNMFFSPYNVGNMICLAYIERTDHETDYYKNVYLPFPLYQMYGPVYGCDLPTYGEGNYESDGRHHLNYELEGNRLHVYGEVFTQCGPNNYAYFISDSDNIYVETSIRKFHLEIQEVEPLMDCCALYATDFYVDGFDPAFDYIIVDNQGEEHPVIKNPADYRPMVEDGKVWQVGAIDTGNPVQWVEYYYFDGETVIDGKNCKQMMWKQYINPDLGVSYSNNSPEYVGAWYEEDKKVYAYDESDKQFKLMYDFSLDDNATLQMDGKTYMIGPRQAGGMNYFKGMWRNVWKYENGETTYQYAPWLEGVGTVYGPPTINLFSVALGDPMWFLMSCTVGDEVIYYDGFSEDGATPGGMNAPKRRFDFTHTTKTRPKTPNRRSEEQSLYGEYNDQLLGINLNPLDETYQVRITDQAGKVVYEKDVNAGSIVGLNIDISAYAKGRYIITMENSQELFTGEFETETTGIEGVRSKGVEARDYIYNLQGQRLESVPRKGIYIQNGKMYVAK